MDDLSPYNAVGAITNSALFLAGLIVAGIASDDHLVIALAIATAGLAYISYAIQISRPGNFVGFATSAISNVTGIVAGIALLVRYWG